jgi:arylsulfatase A-like enzyme
VDSALGHLVSTLDLEHDPSTVLFALADHGGGGIAPDHHEGDHPLNTTIPLVVSGAAVRPVSLRDSSLLDVPATVAWLLGGVIPDTYSGRPLVEIFGEPRADLGAIEPYMAGELRTLRAEPPQATTPQRTQRTQRTLGTR